MKLFSFLIIFYSLSVWAVNQPLLSQMHGKKMVVDYSVLKANLHELKVREQKKVVKKNEKVHPLQNIKLLLKPDELLAQYKNFRCLTEEGEPTYAVISKKEAKKNKKFHPRRAWVIDHQEMRLLAVKKAREVSCFWAPAGQEAYPF